MDFSVDFKSYQEKITASVVDVTRSAASVSNQDFNFHRSASERFSKSLDQQNSDLLRLTSRLLKVSTKDTTIKPPSLQTGDDVEDNWRRVIDVVDDLLEKADASLDEYTGALKRLSPTASDAEHPQKKPKLASGTERWTQSTLPKPQQFFRRKVNNFETGPWKPLLTTKPHGQSSLENSLVLDNNVYRHPYVHEIETLRAPTTMYRISEPIQYSPPEDSSAVFVDTEEAVHEMLQELKQAKEIAVDLEHNDKNSFVGMVCLMQISTRDKDWIVDTLKPWRENLQVLNEVFADPSIVKVFHGSTSDIIWLQRDLGLYVVGLFDTYHACQALAFPGKSLKYLLQRFANFEAQKQYQLADWRIRPLPKELLDYARSDTHFLLYIYDNLRNMLLEASTPDWNLMTQVVDASKQECLQIYQRHAYDAENGLGPAGWLRLLMTRSTGYSNEQFGVFRALHEWRDSKARQLDEGEQNIFSNSYLFALAEEMPSRRTQFFVRGLGRAPPHMDTLIPELIPVIWKGRELGKKGLSIYEAIEKNGDKVGHMFGRNRPQKKPENATRGAESGVAATLKLINQNGPPASPAQAEINSSRTDQLIASRTRSSLLFGDVNPAPPSITTNPIAIEQALQHILRLDLLQSRPSLTEPEKKPQAEQLVLPDAGTNGSLQVHVKQDEIFTLKDRSRKRKVDDREVDHFPSKSSPLPAHSTHVAQDSMSLDFQHVNDITDEVDDPREAKRRRKAEKRAKKTKQAAERKAAQENVVPFDYANAESVLHAKPESVAASVSSAKKPMNPFARAMDTSTGARRAKAGKEQPGKSQTFLN